MQQLKLNFSFKFLRVYLIAGLLVSSAFICGPSYAQDNDLQASMEEVKLKSKHLLKQLEGLRKSTSTKSQDSQEKELLEANSDIGDTQKLIDLLRPYQQMEISEIEGQLRESLSQGKMKSMVTKFPLVITFMAHLLKDPEAMPRLLTLSQDKERMKEAGLYLVASFIFALILGRFLRNHQLGFFSRLKRWTFKVTLVWSIRLGIIYHFYGESLAPTVKIFNDVVVPALLT